MKKVFLSLVAVALLSGCGGGVQKLETTDSRECTQNFTYEGGFLSGKTYKTSATVKNVSKTVAMNRVAKSVAKDGWQILGNNSQSGVMSATKDQGKTVPLNIVFEQTKKNTFISITYTGGSTPPLNTVVDEVCSIIASASKK